MIDNKDNNKLDDIKSVRYYTVALRVNKYEKETIDFYAKAHGLSRSEFLRAAIERCIENDKNESVNSQGGIR